MASPRALSKSRVLAGLQCPKRLYLRVTAPELAEAPDAALRFRFAQGQEVGRLAREAFPGGVAVESGPDRLDAALARTAALLRDPTVPAIFEATFRHDDVLVRVDVLARGTRGGWRLVEVKSTAGVKEHHLPDVAIQRHVLAGSGITVESVAVMHLSRDYVYAGGAHDPMRLFAIVDVTPLWWTPSPSTCRACLPSCRRRWPRTRRPRSRPGCSAPSPISASSTTSAMSPCPSTTSRICPGSTGTGSTRSGPAASPASASCRWTSR